MKNKICKWRAWETVCGEPYNVWDTECGEAFTITEGTLADNKFAYCPFCGGEIK